MKIYQLRSACSNNPPTAKCLIRKPNNKCECVVVIGGFLEKAFRSWWIFMRKDLAALVNVRLGYLRCGALCFALLGLATEGASLRGVKFTQSVRIDLGNLTISQSAP